MNAIESLGCVVKDTRIRLGYTQNQLAEKIGVEVRTIMHIENGIANPTWEVVFPLIRALGIDPRLVFYPELNRDDEAMAHIQILLSKCSEEDIQSLIPICETVLGIFHERGGIQIGDK
ncbi:MAG: helix-turn-helix domain-containing protein [Clostridia bacterium]|nr:helix-turn-helix domain-containing protein [Clostridia bacterium]